MPIYKLRNKQSVSDDEFDSILPEDLREHSNRHFTSVFLSQKASQFLSDGKDIEILDIGSGTGKFCLVGAIGNDAHFTGVEHRKHLVDIAKDIANKYVIPNVSFIHESILNIDFRTYDAFYIFNPFLETHDPSARMDGSVKLEADDFTIFKNYVHDQLAKKEIGTRVASYWTSAEQIPDSYEIISKHFGETLCFWEKVK